MIEKDDTSDLSNKERDWLRRAITLAEFSDQRHKHGAVAVKGNRVIGFGVNTHRNHPKVVDGAYETCSIHAEVSAARQNPSAGKGASMYVARVNRQGQTRLSRPCDACYLFLKNLGYHKVIFTS